MQKNFPMIRKVPFTGVIWVNAQAASLGYYNGNPQWCNLGQGQPEVGDIEGAEKRLSEIHIRPEDQAYGPVGGTLANRQMVADMYNARYRKGKSQYTAANVTIASGGRVILTRIFNILADMCKILYRNPDYTAYEDYLNYQRLHTDLQCEFTTPENGFVITSERLKYLAEKEGVNAFIFSNPNNPTGSVVEGDELKRYVEIARNNKMLLGIDEIYSHYIYNKEDGSPAEKPVSAAEYVDDVETDPVILIDGLTKNHRYPGWRCCWAVGPSYLIEMLNRAASALDGGPSMLSQRVMLEAMKPERFDAEVLAVRKLFAKKRLYMIDRLNKMGIKTTKASHSTFYIWANIEDLPEPINDGDEFFFACLKEKVIVVPGKFFDIHPYRDHEKPEPLRHWVRLSYGPDFDVIKRGLDGIEKVIKEHKK